MKKVIIIGKRIGKYISLRGAASGNCFCALGVEDYFGPIRQHGIIEFHIQTGRPSDGEGEYYVLKKNTNMWYITGLANPRYAKIRQRYSNYSRINEPKIVIRSPWNFEIDFVINYIFPDQDRLYMYAY